MQKGSFQVIVCACFVFAACLASFGGSAPAASEKVLHSFTGGSDGSDPDSGLTLAANGHLFGSTFFGGTAGQGVVYKLAPSSTGWQETVLYNFKGGTSDGANPSGELLLAGGNIFGTASSGGNGNGIVFELTPSTSGWTETILHVFAKDQSPNDAGVIMDKAGNLYGETAGGGANNDGTIYELKKTSTGYTYRLLYSFASGNDGDFPIGGLIFDAAGNLYGVTASGGPNFMGDVFELKRGTNGTWTESILYTFQSTADGVNPESPLAFDSSGNLWGTTVFGGDTSCAQGFGCGEVFELMPAGNGTWAKSTIHAFTDTPDGHDPQAGVTFDSAGNIWGTTNNGGGFGTGCIYELSPQSGGWSESVYYSFSDGSDGGFPLTPVTFDSKGHMYGTASSGGSNNHGVAYAFSGVPAQ